MGDPSDGLPGVPRWGPKAAAAVLERYGCVEDIPDDARTWDLDIRGARALGDSLRARRREAILMRNLSRLRTDVPIEDTVGHLEWQGAERSALTELVSRIGADGIIERVPRWRVG